MTGTWRIGTSLLLAVLVAGGCSKARHRPVTAAETLVDSGSGGRIVIRSGRLELRVRDLGAFQRTVEELVTQLDGWVEEWSERDNRWLWMTVRVPATELDRTMDHFASLGRVKSRSLRSRDVTEQTIDLETRLTHLKALRDRLRAYLEQATALQDILAVEEQLTRVQTEIESLEAKLKVLRSQIEMSELELIAKGRR